MEGEFAALYRGLIGRIEPDPLRLRRGLGALFPPGVARAAEKPLQSDEKCGIGYPERENDENNTRESGG